MFERSHQKLLPRTAYYRRLARNGSMAFGIIGFSLLLGSIGYHLTEDLPWVDSLLNASMILTGMGPVDHMNTTGGKLFATFYAVYSGVVFLTAMAVILAPAYHRFLHRFHMEEKGS